MIRNDENNEKITKLFDKDKIKSIKESIEFIRRDVDRTFYLDYFTKGDGKKELKEVLESMCTVKNNVGYCQGMNFIVGGMIYLLKSKIRGFYLFNCLLNSYELNTLFAYNTPDYNARVFQLNHYVKKYIPTVFHHFKKENISFDLLYTNWLLTLFANYISIEKLDFPWTCFIIDKWKGLIKICLILIYELKDQLLKCDLPGLTMLLKDNVSKYHNNYRRSFFLYKNKFKVTNSQLRQLKNEYYSELAKKKLESTNQEIDKWDDDQKQPLLEYLKEKEKIELNVNKDIESYKKLNEESIKNYLLSLKRYDNFIQHLNTLRKRIDELATLKYNYEEIFHQFKVTISQLEENENKDEYIERKITIINEEKNSLLERYLHIKEEYNTKTQLLYQQGEVFDKLKREIQKSEKTKNKRKQLMQDYLFLYEKKQDELIKNFTDKLKLSDHFKKTNGF